MVFVKKETEVNKLIMQHFELVGQVLEELQKLVDDYLACNKAFKEECSVVDRLEHQADEVRRDIECKLYEGAFLPIYREDYIHLIEQVDQIANQAEAVSQFITLTRPEIPEMIREDFRQIAVASVESFQVILVSVEAIQKDMKKVFAVSEEVQQKEKEIDDIVWRTVKKIFKSDMDKGEKIHVKMLIDRIAAISNRVEDTADRLVLMAVKRNV